MTSTATAKLSIDVTLLPRGGGSRVLDVGCGDGRHIVEAARRGCFSVGVDYDAAALRTARARVDGQRIDFVVADASRLPFRDGAFDAVICTETLEHLPDDTGAISEIARVLVAGGTMLGAVPSHFTELLYWRLSWAYWHTPGGHVRIYRPSQLAAAFAWVGLEFSSMRYLHFVDSLVWLRFCVRDALRPRRAATQFEAAVMLAVAAERPVPAWRSSLRRALARSRFIAAIDAAGALVWPKSLMFVVTKQGSLPNTRIPSIAAGQHAVARPIHSTSG